MNKNRKVMSIGRRGFTLIELLVVISIISILSIITVSQFRTAQKKARDAQRKADMDSLSKSLILYFTDYGYFPNSSGGQVAIAPWGGAFVDGVGYTYMVTVPKENYQESFPYCYVVSADRKKFGLFTMLENKDDKDCHLNGDNSGAFEHCGNSYCFYRVSPNTSVNDL